MVLRAFLAVICAALPTVSASATDSDSFLVASYNIRYANPNDGDDVWPNRVDAVVDFIAQNDVIGLQEVTHPQLLEIRDRLDGYDHYGVGRSDGKTGGEYAVIFYRRDLFEVLDKGTFWLSEQPDSVGSRGWDAALPRTCTWMLLRFGDQRLWLANTHFDHRGEQARRKSAALIRQIADQHADAVCPTIILGDFNCIAGSGPYDALTSDSDEKTSVLIDARTISQNPPQGPNSTWNGFKEIVPDRIIDHIFVRGPVEVARFETLDPRTDGGRFASDHLPVRAVVRIGGVTSAIPR